MILLPKAPLVTGKTYSVAIKVNNVVYLWSFNTPVTSAKGSEPTPGDSFLP